MAGFSIDAALRSGFRLARREWKTVLAWGASLVVLAMLAQILVAGPALPAYLAEVASDPEGAAAAMEAATLANAWWSYPLVLLAGLVTTAMFYGAVCRALLRPGERGFFYLRFGRGERWLLLTVVAFYALVLAAALPAMFIVFAVADAVSQSGASGGLWMVLLVLSLGAGGWYLIARLSLAFVMAWDEERLALADAWRLTRGQGGRIMLMMLALVFLVAIAMLVVVVPTVMVAGIIVGVAGLSGSAGLVFGIALGLAALVFFCAFYGVFYTVGIAPYVEVYRQLRDGRAASAAS